MPAEPAPALAGIDAREQQLAEQPERSPKLPQMIPKIDVAVADHAVDGEMLRGPADGDEQAPPGHEAAADQGARAPLSASWRT